MRFIPISLICLGIACSAWAQTTPVRPLSPANITILTDEQLIQPTLPLTRAYSKKRHAPLTSAVMASNVEDQISQGLEAHVLLTADKTLLEHLTARGVTDVSATHPFTQTRLALVTTRNNNTNALFAKHLSFAAMIYATPTLPVYLEPALSDAGTRSTVLLKGFEFSPSLEGRTQTMTSHAELLSALRESNGLALMLASDAAMEPDMIVLSILPEALTTPIPFYAIVLASEAMDDARAFVKFLDSTEAHQMLAKSGFETPKN
jgi:molybdate transport system substrate-binding protein